MSRRQALGGPETPAMLPAASPAGPAGTLTRRSRTIIYVDNGTARGRPHWLPYGSLPVPVQHERNRRENPQRRSYDRVQVGGRSHRARARHGRLPEGLRLRRPQAGRDHGQAGFEVSNGADGQRKPQFNPIFAEFYAKAPEAERPHALIAYGLYKIAKREWATDLFERENRAPTEADLAAYVHTWTPSQFDGKRAEARSILSAYADDVVEAAAPGIEKAALRGSWARAIGYGIAANIVYTLLLIVILLILKSQGVDVLGLAEKIGPPAAATAPEPAPKKP